MATTKPGQRVKDFISPRAPAEEHCLHKLNIGMRDNPAELLAAAEDFVAAYKAAGFVKRKLFSLTRDFERFADQSHRLAGIPYVESMLKAAYGHNMEISGQLAFDYQPAGRQLVVIPDALRERAQHNCTLGIFERAVAGRVFAETVIKRHEAQVESTTPGCHHS